MQLSFELIKEVVKEVRVFPPHARRVMVDRLTKEVIPFEKYYYGLHRKQYFCWFDPENIERDHLIIFFHGGAWTFGSPELFNNRAALFADDGFEVLMPSHRRLPRFRYPHIRTDLRRMLQKLDLLMTRKNIRHKKIILGGMSSGGNLAALMLFDPGLLDGTGFRPDDFAGAFLCAAPVNLEGMTDSFLLTRYAGKKAASDYSNASPINHLPNRLEKPVLLIHGTEDGLVKYQSTADFVAALKNINRAPVTFHTLPGGSHLDAVSWAYEDNEIRKVILHWIRQIAG